MITKKETIQILLNLDQSTIIDENWWGYLMEKETLLALLVFTDLNSYERVLKFYEGYTIDKLINEILEK